MRTKLFGLFAPVLAFLLNANMALAADVTTIEIIEFGEYNVQRTGSAEEYKTGMLKSKVKAVTFVKQTKKIHATHSNAIGVRYKVHGSPVGEAVTIKKVLKTPGITPPGKKTVFDHVGYYKVYIGKPKLYWWGFREKWEMVPGIYKIQLFHNDRMLAEKTFKVLTSPQEQK